MSAVKRLRRKIRKCTLAGVLAMMTVGMAPGGARTSSDEDRLQVARLDRQFQAAVKINNAHAMDRILGEGMVLVHGDGQIDSRDELLREAREKLIIYESQDEDPGTQTVRVWGDTAVVTARLWVKGRYKGALFDRRLWFSDVYVRTRGGWRYIFGQASLHLPDGA